MQNLVIKIKKSIEKIETEKGSPFKLKCLVSKNSDSDMKWDLILSTEWFDSTSEMERLDYLAKIIFPEFNTSDLLDFSSIITYTTTESNSLIEYLLNLRRRFVDSRLNDSSNYGDDIRYSLRECRGFEQEEVIFL